MSFEFLGVKPPFTGLLVNQGANSEHFRGALKEAARAIADAWEGHEFDCQGQKFSEHLMEIERMLLVSAGEV